jgi:isopenicillin N synthase-like dioxygenase
VVNPKGPAAYRSRYSMPFFLHFRPDFDIVTLPGCIDPARPDDHPEPISSHEFLQQRLREIKLA